MSRNARLDPLGDQLERELNPFVTAKKKKRDKSMVPMREFMEETTLPADLSRKILKQARAQQLGLPHSGRSGAREPVAESGGRGMLDLLNRGGDMLEEEYDVDVDEGDEEALRWFRQVSTAPPVRTKTLGDLIMDKLEAHLAAKDAPEQVQGAMEERLSPKIMKAYKQVGEYMQVFKSGKLPKAFNIIPEFANWEELLWVTQPQLWTAHAVFRATRLFAAVMDPQMAQRYYALVLLPRVRADVAARKNVARHVFDALRKATYKPGAFFKGVVLPLAEDRECTTAEGKVVASVVKKSSFPVLHAAAAIMKLAEMPYSFGSGLFLQTLIAKRYALPYKTIDALFIHFMSFLDDDREMPKLWFRCLLTYAERYKTDLESEQKEALKALLRRHQHPQFSPQIRRELYSSLCRDNTAQVVDDIDDLTQTAAQALAEAYLAKHAIEED